MRLHRLEICAFGPYAGAATVDFDALGADGLFLLYGQTGAGKTTILDAIAYALFGRVPGPRQQAGRLRCDYADPAAAPRVTLELTLGHRRLRVLRSPEWQRPKLRGAGTTRENAKATLEERDAGEWRAISTRIDEVSEQLHQWLGMSAEQFFQVVLLPQGEFARFLRAESTEREELLERLFGTRRFGDVESWLAGQRRAAKEAVAEAEERIRGLLARLCQAAGVVGEPEVAEPGWVADLVAESAAVRAAAAVEASRAELTLNRAVAEHEQVVGLRRRQERRLLAEQARAKLEASRDEQDARRGEVAQARRAASVLPFVRSAGAAAEAESRCVLAAERAVGRLAPLTTEDLSDPDALREWAERLRGDVVLLDAAAAEERGVDLASAELVRLGTSFAELHDQAGAHAAAAAVLPVRIAGVRAAIGERERAAARVDSLAAECARVASMLSAARSRDALVLKCAQLHDAVLAAADEHQRARETVLELREQRLDGYASELAEALRPGEPCGVCGGVEHPRPARPAGGERVTEQAEAAARAAEELARAVRAAAEAEQATVERELTRLGALTGGREIGELEMQSAALEREAAMLAELASGLQACRAELAELEAELVRGTEVERRLAGAIAAAEAELVQRRGAHDRLVARLDDVRQEDPSIAARCVRLSALAADVDALREALRAASTARAARGLADRAAALEAEQAGFEDLESASAAWLEGPALAALEAECREWEDLDAATASALADPELAGLGEFELVDVEPAAIARDLAAAAHAAAHAAVRYAEHREEQVSGLARQLLDALADTAPARARCAQVTAVADLVAGQGQNARRMTLRAYVLASRLDEVARCASQRLRRMSAGRYAFVFTGDADSKRVRAGLNLRILDDYSGQARSTRTLSGGESFMASLALALGLADVVAAEAGGTQLETLFIDEGFGSLDADTLDLVMDTLDDLRAGGRVIGVVSHVAEMRQRIPMRLRVSKAGLTSRAELEAG